VKLPVTAFNEFVVCMAAFPTTTLLTVSYFLKFSTEAYRTKDLGDWMSDFDGDF
jgi:hypothetical protein